MSLLPRTIPIGHVRAATTLHARSVPAWCRRSHPRPNLVLPTASRPTESTPLPHSFTARYRNQQSDCVLPPEHPDPARHSIPITRILPAV